MPVFSSIHFAMHRTVFPLTRPLTAQCSPLLDFFGHHFSPWDQGLRPSPNLFPNLNSLDSPTRMPWSPPPFCLSWNRPFISLDPFPPPAVLCFSNFQGFP